MSPGWAITLTRATPWMPASLVELPTLFSISSRPRRVEGLGGEIVGGCGHGHVGDALRAQGVARRDVHAARVVRVRAAEVAGQRRELGGVGLLLAEHPEQGRLEELVAVGAHLHALGEDGLLGGEGVGRLEAVGAHGDLVLLRAELGELGRELLAREPRGVGDELVELLAELGGVADGGARRPRSKCGRTRPCGFAGSCAPTRPRRRR